MTPRYSILIPTKDRLEYLVQAVETIQRQGHPSWEVIISDNASTNDVESRLAEWGDSRIRYRRQSHAIPVTDNWNAALADAVGEWVIMLGDDDGLMPGALKRLDSMIERYDPDVIYVEAWSLTYPGAIPGVSSGRVQPIPSIAPDSDQPFILSHADARSLVDKAAHFETPVTFNMQHFVVSHKVISALSMDGSFFRSPYPDFYASNALFAHSTRLLICPDRLVAIGITPKSFGSFYFKGSEAEGVTFLGNNDVAVPPGLRNVVLEGSPDRTSWLLAMEALRAGPIPDLHVDYGRYRRLVIYSALGGGLHEVRSAPMRRRILRRLTLPELVFVAVPIMLGAVLTRSLPHRVRRAVRALAHRVLVRSTRLEANYTDGYPTMLDLFARPPEIDAAASSVPGP